MTSRGGRECQALITPVRGRGRGRDVRYMLFLSTSSEGKKRSSDSSSPALEAAKLLPSGVRHSSASQVLSSAMGREDSLDVVKSAPVRERECHSNLV